MKQQPMRTLLGQAILVTGNRGKAGELGRIIGVELAHEAIDLPEIQELDLLAVLKAKGDEAFRRLGRPLIVDETGLELVALGGFPGPLIKWLLQAIGADGIARLAASLGETRVTARCAVLYRDEERSLIGEGSTSGRIVPARGSQGFGWDPIFLPDGEALTYAEIDAARKDAIGHRGKALRALMEKLEAVEA